MTRFARAKGSKSSNEKAPEDSTPWEVMKEQLLEAKKESEESKKRQEAEQQRIENYENFLKERRVQKKPSTWCDFPDTAKIENKKKTDKESIKETKEKSFDPNKLDSKKKKKKHNKSNGNSESNEFTTENVENNKKKKKRISENTEHSNLTSNNMLSNDEISDSSGPPVKKKKKKNKQISQPQDGESQDIGKDSSQEENLSKKKKKNKSATTNVPNSNNDNNLNISTKQKKQMNNENSNKIDNSNISNNNNKKNKDKTKKKNKRINGKPIRRKEINDKSFQLIINGKEVELVRFDGFPIMKKDAERLTELKNSMINKGIPKSEVQRTMKLERRRAEKALARIKRDVCYNCRKGGHNLSDCPELKSKIPGVDAPEGVCFKCGSTEHRQFECKVQRDKEFRFATCFICKEPGHIARQCPDNPKGLYPNGGSCKLCGDVTHLRKDCPTTNITKEETSVKLQTLDSTDNIEDIGAQTKATVVNDTVKKPKKIRF